MWLLELRVPSYLLQLISCIGGDSPTVGIEQTQPPLFNQPLSAKCQKLWFTLNWQWAVATFCFCFWSFGLNSKNDFICAQRLAEREEQGHFGGMGCSCSKGGGSSKTITDVKRANGGPGRIEGRPSMQVRLSCGSWSSKGNQKGTERPLGTNLSARIGQIEDIISFQ